jgi:hypothetical protein
MNRVLFALTIILLVACTKKNKTQEKVEKCDNWPTEITIFNDSYDYTIDTTSVQLFIDDTSYYLTNIVSSHYFNGAIMVSAIKSSDPEIRIDLQVVSAQVGSNEVYTLDMKINSSIGMNITSSTINITELVPSKYFSVEITGIADEKDFEISINKLNFIKEECQPDYELKSELNPDLVNDWKIVELRDCLVDSVFYPPCNSESILHITSSDQSLYPYKVELEIVNEITSYFLITGDDKIEFAGALSTKIYNPFYPGYFEELVVYVLSYPKQMKFEQNNNLLEISTEYGFFMRLALVE